MKILILASGRGSNARAVMEAAASGKIRAEVCALFSDVADAPALSIAREFSRARALYRPGEAGRAPIARRRGGVYRSHAGGSRGPRGFGGLYADSSRFDSAGVRGENDKPAPEPFAGVQRQRRHTARVRGGGSARWVQRALRLGRARRRESDSQKAVDILPSDTLETFEGRVHAAEHALLVGVVSGFADGKTRPRGSEECLRKSNGARAGISAFSARGTSPEISPK